MPKSNATTPNTAILTVDELAAFLRVNRKSVYQAIHAGKMPGARRLGRTWRISLAAVLKWLARGERFEVEAERVECPQI